MPPLPRSTLEQWAVVKAIVESGSFAAAAEQLHRSQSSISYAVHQLQTQLGVVLFQQEGRRAVLQPLGKALLDRAEDLLKNALALEQCATALQSGYEAELSVVVDAAFPTLVLLQALEACAESMQYTRIQLHEEILSGAEEAIRENKADISIATSVPQGVLADQILSTEFIAVVSPQHPLSGQPSVSNDVLMRHRQVVIRDSGVRQPRDVGWLGAEQRWTVSSLQTAQEVVASGLAFAWLPIHQVRTALERGELTALQLTAGARRVIWFYLLTSPDATMGKMGQLLCQALRDSASVFQKRT